MSGVQTTARVVDIVLGGTQHSSRHSAQNPPSKELFPSLSTVQTTNRSMAKQPTLPLLMSTNTLALLWPTSPIWPCLPQWPLPNYLDHLKYHHEGE